MFLAFLKNKTSFLAPFSSENHDFPIMQQWKDEKIMEKKKSFLPTYPTKIYSVGVQQTIFFF